MARKVTKDALLEALRKVRTREYAGNGDGALTTMEMSRELGVRKDVIYTLLDILGDEVEVIWVQRPCRTGVVQRIPAYRLRNVTTQNT